MEWPIAVLIVCGCLAIGVHTIPYTAFTAGQGIAVELPIERTHNSAAQLIETYCSGCHASGRSGIDFDPPSLTLEEMRNDLSTWKMALARLRSHEMPPRRFPQPTKDEREFLLSWLEEEVIHERHQARGKFMARRLHRSEYLNSVRDLLGIQTPIELDLPNDESGWRRCEKLPETFEHLRVYLVAAEKALDQAIAAELEREAACEEDDCRVPEPMFSSEHSCLPTSDYARGILADFVRRAYRKPVDSSEVAPYSAIFERAQANGQNFRESMKRALAEVLTSKDFLYRIEVISDTPETPASNQITLAERLSYFLWRSTPDDVLLAQAESGQLAENLERQVDRMLKDPRANQFAMDFAESWFSLTKISAMTHLDDKLRLAIRQETEQFMGHMLQENRNVAEFLDSDYAFLNERLATHYGLSGIFGDGMRRVDVRGTQRGGLIGQASVLILTTPASDTSPVNRGKWVAENLMGSAPIKPPPGLLQALDGLSAKTKPGTIRENLELHRQIPSCAQCHAQLDSIGLALEFFDGTGEWRNQYSHMPIDALSILPDGTPLRNPAEVKAYLLRHRSSFVHGLRARLLQFALGRKIDDRERAALELDKESSASNEHRFSRVILDVVQSAPFQQAPRAQAVTESRRSEE